MEDKSHALWAGIFTLVLGVAVIAALFWFGGQRESSTEYLVVTRQNVSGLNPQSQVRYRGITVGKVRDIALDPADPGNILVKIGVRDGVPITKSTVAKIAHQGITGIAHVLLEDEGSNREPLVRNENGEFPRILMRQSLFAELGESSAGTLKYAQSFLLNASETLNAENRESLSRILSNLEKNTEQLNKILSDERVQNIGASIARFDRATDAAGLLLTDARTVLPRVDALSVKLETMIGNEANGGAMATVAQIGELSGELAITSRQLNRTLRSLEQSPQSILFGPPSPQPGPGEPGFTSNTAGRGRE